MTAERIQIFGVCGTLALAVALAFGIARFPGARLPQAAQSSDILSIAFGDAKKVIGAAMLQKADSYYHGGVDMDAGHHCETRHHEHDSDCHDECHHHHSSEHSNVPSSEHSLHFPDPWRWINTRIRAPQVERHLEGKKAVELIPLLWASVHADPQNADAWTTAWYIAEKTMKDPDLGLRIIRTGERLNPTNVAIALTLGRALFRNRTGDLAAAEAAFESARRKGRTTCGGDFSKLEESEVDAYLAALDYLAWFASRRKDRVALMTLLNEARAAGRPSPVPDNIERLLSEP